MPTKYTLTLMGNRFFPSEIVNCVAPVCVEGKVFHFFREKA